MKAVSNDYKNAITLMGRQFNAYIDINDSNGGHYNLEGDVINSISLSYDGRLYKTIMQQCIIDIDKDAYPSLTDGVERRIVITFDLLIDEAEDEWESITSGEYIVKDIEEQKDTNSLRITCYDNMLLSMVNYNGVEITFPTTLRTYINTLASHLGVSFYNINQTFPNYDKVLENDLFLDSEGESLGYTFRDVLDDIAEATGRTFLIKDGSLKLVSTKESEYQEVDYIQSSGTQYIDTGMKLNQNSKVELKVSDITYGSYKLFGSRSSATSNNYSILTTGSGLVLDFQNYNNNRLSASNLDNVITLSMSNQKLQANDTSKNIGTYTNFTTPSNAYIFNGAGSFPNQYGLASAKLYYCKIWQDNVLVRDLIPCYRKNDNAIGLYDKVNDVFYANAGTGTFTYGAETQETIDESYFKDINVDFGERFGPINKLSLTRSADSDVIYRNDETSIEASGETEVSFGDNQLLSQDDREEWIDAIFNEIKDTEYYLNDYSSTGITYLEPLDKYNVSIGENTYSCIMLSDEINITQGLEENVHTDRPDEATTDYATSSTTDRMALQTRLIVNKQLGQIVGEVASKTDISNLQGQIDANGDAIESLGTRVTQTESDITFATTTLDDITDEDGNVTKVKNSLVTINADGIEVATNTSEIKTQMTNDAFIISDTTGQLARFDNDGAFLDNLSVEHYFIAGNHRVEKDNDRTSWFYIGG